MMIKKRLLLSGLITALILCNVSYAGIKKGKAAELSDLEKIFKSNKLKPEKFGPARWSKTGSAYTLLVSEDKDKKIKNIIEYSPRSKKYILLLKGENLIPKEESNPISIEDYKISSDKKNILIFTNSKKVWRTNTRGDYWIYNLASGSIKKLGGKAPASSLMFAKFSPDGKKAAYVSERNIFVENIQNNSIIQLTATGSDHIINGTFDWVYEEEFHMKDGFRWSPDGQKISFWQFDITGVKDFYLINNTDELYSKIIPVQYPKAGETNSSCRIGVINASGGDIKWFEFPGDPGNHYLARMDWAGNPKELVIQRLNREQNRNNIILADVNNGNTRTIFTEKDEAWIDVEDNLFWLKKGKYFTWVSERDGWKHIYIVSRDGKEFRLITPGQFDIISIEAIDTKKGLIYFTASPDNPAQQYLFSARIFGKNEVTRITPLNTPGTHGYKISKNGRYAFHFHSDFSTPETISMISLPGHKRISVIENNSRLLSNLKDLKPAVTEFFKADIGNGVLLDAWIMKPWNFDKDKKYPVLFYVYGEPWGQTVKDRWGGTTYLWHRMLTRMGYIVASVDNRGTPSPRGREFRKSVHLKVGIISTMDQAKAAESIIKNRPYIDGNRIGVWGWSGGGSMTLNLMFKFPEIYKTGISIAPVADMRYYDSVYQERYMGLPSENKKGYKNGSPINFASGLKGKLLLIHGTGDDNVHYQNSEALINKLIEHNKQFSMMAYPNRAHSIRKGKNTRLHLFTLMTGFLTENLPGKQ